MKKKIGLILTLVLILLCAAALADVEINETNFPDDIFREKYVKQFDTSGDGILSEEELSAVVLILIEPVSSEGDKGKIKSLEGIQHFSSLTNLECRHQALEELDVSCFPHLRYLWVEHNNLTSLDVTHNSELINLWCSDNQLTSLDVSKNASLTVLSCNNNSLGTLDVSHNPLLTGLNVGSTGLKDIDLSNNKELTSFDARDNMLTSLDFSGYSNLNSLICSNNMIKSLNISGCSQITYLLCDGNLLTELDISHLTDLKDFWCQKNQIETLDTSGKSHLEDILCGWNKIKELDISECPNLETLGCQSNQISTLDVRNCPELYSFACQLNPLAELDVTHNPKLHILEIYGTSIQEIDISNCPKLCKTAKESTRVRSAHGILLDQYVRETPEARNSDSIISLDIFTTVYAGDFTGHPLIPCFFATVFGEEVVFPDLYFYEVLDPFDLNEDGFLDDLEINQIRKINCSKMNIATLAGIDRLPELTEMNCSKNYLTNLDVSRNTKLTRLNCTGNDLSTLNVSQCPALCSLVQNEKRVTDVKGGYDVWGNPKKADGTWLMVDRNVTVIAGKKKSNPTGGKTFAFDGLKYETLSGKKVAFTGVQKSRATVEIPDTVEYGGKTFKVTEIASKALKQDKKLKTLIIGKNITSIGKEAFRDCAKLKSITIRTKKLTEQTVGKNAFKGIAVKPTVTCPKGMVKTYQKLLLKKGMPKKATFK